MLVLVVVALVMYGHAKNATHPFHQYDNAAEHEKICKGLCPGAGARINPLAQVKRTPKGMIRAPGGDLRKMTDEELAREAKLVEMTPYEALQYGEISDIDMTETEREQKLQRDLFILRREARFRADDEVKSGRLLSKDVDQFKEDMYNTLHAEYHTASSGRPESYKNRETERQEEIVTELKIEIKELKDKLLAQINTATARALEYLTKINEDNDALESDKSSAKKEYENMIKIQRYIKDGQWDIAIQMGEGILSDEIIRNIDEAKGLEAQLREQRERLSELNMRAQVNLMRLQIPARREDAIQTSIKKYITSVREKER